jgi:hypothetical protein
MYCETICKETKDDAGTNSETDPGHIPSVEELLGLFESFAARQGKLEISLAVRRGLELKRIYQ